MEIHVDYCITPCSIRLGELSISLWADRDALERSAQNKTCETLAECFGICKAFTSAALSLLNQLGRKLTEAIVVLPQAGCGLQLGDAQDLSVYPQGGDSEALDLRRKGRRKTGCETVPTRISPPLEATIILGQRFECTPHPRPVNRYIGTCVRARAGVSSRLLVSLQ